MYDKPVQVELRMFYFVIIVRVCTVFLEFIVKSRVYLNLRGQLKLLFE